jgi:signal transduction histidine kinase
MLDLISRLTEYPGNFAYYVVLILSIAGGMYLSYRKWRADKNLQARRAIFGSIMLLSGLLLLMLASGFQNSQTQGAITQLPPLDRAFTLFSILWIIWLWAFPNQSGIADLGAILFSLMLLSAGILNVFLRSVQLNTSDFNNSTNDIVWQAACIVSILFGIFILVIRRPDGFIYGISMLGLLLLGHTTHLIVQPDGNFSGIYRLFQLSAFPILLILPRNFNNLTVEQVDEEKVESNVEVKDRPPVKPVKKSKLKATDGRSILTERRRYSSDPKTFTTMLALASETDPTGINQEVPRAVGQAMLADLCFLLLLAENKNQLTIAAGYDLIREEILESGTLNKSAIPMLSNAIQRGRPLRLPAESTSVDLKGLGDLLGLKNAGHLMSVPILTSNKVVLGGLLLLSPYSDRVWSADDQTFLMSIASGLVPILQRTQNATPPVGNADPIAELEHRNQELTNELETLRKQAEETNVNTRDFSAMMLAQQSTQQELDDLRRENLELQAKARQLPVMQNQLGEELNAALKENSQLKNQLASRDLDTHESGRVERGERNKEQTEVIASLAQELRQPMSSAVGYTDLLLGESVGILGALQRKFVERIKGSIEKINKLLDDMIQVTTMEVDLVDLKAEPVDLNQIIDNAMSYTAGQVREKNISMHLDLPKKVAPVYANREALQQILIHLLQNAGSASAVEGTITLTVKTQQENGQEHVLVQVTDSGGGIPAEELSRVFTRLYRADNVLIQGVGDTGVGLSIARTLTEAQNGRIWVDSEPGVGSTFSVLFPVTVQPESKPAKARGAR